jgi:hypothetical protein
LRIWLLEESKKHKKWVYQIITLYFSRKKIINFGSKKSDFQSEYQEKQYIKNTSKKCSIKSTIVTWGTYSNKNNSLLYFRTITKCTLEMLLSECLGKWQWWKVMKSRQKFTLKLKLQMIAVNFYGVKICNCAMIVRKRVSNIKVSYIVTLKS